MLQWIFVHSHIVLLLPNECIFWSHIFSLSVGISLGRRNKNCLFMGSLCIYIPLLSTQFSRNRKMDKTARRCPITWNCFVVESFRILFLKHSSETCGHILAFNLFNLYSFQFYFVVKVRSYDLCILRYLYLFNLCMGDYRLNFTYDSFALARIHGDTKSNFTSDTWIPSRTSYF